MNYEKSNAFYERAAIIPGRSNTRSKAPGKFFAVGSGPLYFSHGFGAVVEDVDGNAFVDFLCALGAISIGYGMADSKLPPPPLGVGSLPHYLEVQASESVLSNVAPWAKFVRSVRTGSEATTAATMIARRATGRMPVLVATTAYHAWHPWASLRGIPMTEGSQTFSFEYGDMDSFERAVVESGPPAAVVIEPARWKSTPDDAEYLRTLQRRSQKLGAIFVVDEMIYGGRWRLGGACELYGLKPDLATFGKALGNGRPVAFVVGGDVLGEHGELVSGTYSGDVSSLSQVVEVINFYKTHDVVAALWFNGKLLRDVLTNAIESAGVSDRVFVEGVAPVHQRIKFEDDELGRVFSAGMAANGILWHPACANVCWAHDDRQIAAAGSATRITLLDMKEKGLL